MSDNLERCEPSDPSVSGWWYIGYIAGAPYPCEIWEWVPNEGRWILPGGEGDGDDGFHAALNGYRILGPVPSHAEVEALRAEITTAQNTARVQTSLWANKCFDLHTQLTAANAEIARLKGLL
jgi:hypothetical protein